ncbi:MAG: isoprenylcysteine carboxylmethyltransferase family protein [Gemmatimonadetes bacterium]|nr:isoprenylcysteine carboxylmethyltransferase family protein [Gemmatimonadota bacterium]
MRRAVAAYFGLQGAGVVGWWAMLFLDAEARQWFRMSPAPDHTLLAFALPDLAILAPASLLGAALVVRRDARAPVVLWVAAGATVYAALYTLAFAVRADAGWLGAALMLPAALLSGSCAAAATPSMVALLRHARPASAGWNTAKTFAQIAVFWGTLLFLVPWLIRMLELRLGVPSFGGPGMRVVAVGLFVALGGLGVWSGVTMARSGRGTPLPLDAPRRLVVSGPYAYVRNPMAIGSLGQGVAVGLYLGSPLVLVYVGIGAWMWQVLARPLEEMDLARHFGAEYEAYRDAVRCWCPNLTAFRAPTDARQLSA